MPCSQAPSPMAVQEPQNKWQKIHERQLRKLANSKCTTAELLCMVHTFGCPHAARQRRGPAAPITQFAAILEVPVPRPASMRNAWDHLAEQAQAAQAGTPAAFF